MLEACSPASVPANTIAALPQPATAPTHAAVAVSQVAASSPNCSSPASLTPSMTEGPFFKAGSPERVADRVKRHRNQTRPDGLRFDGGLQADRTCVIGFLAGECRWPIR